MSLHNCEFVLEHTINIWTMASIILASAGAAIGGSLTATAVGALTGKVVGTFVGGMLDSALLGEQAMHASSNGRLESIVMQSAGYGHDIPTVYGMAKLAGNIIWASGLTEHSSTSSETHGSKWHKVRYTHTDYVYTLSFAIAICAGPITGVNRIWANDILLNKENDGIRIYCGDETQIVFSLQFRLHRLAFGISIDSFFHINDAEYCRLGKTGD